ncbi:ABC transporter permease [Pseudoflavonifractor capillosus]|uniref:ABC transporter permease n=1 Tax=Pseudoflavonifractor capillosus TaxID=106588 RepID=UPI00195A73FD|nr:ABC transporter permease [Pseudoflavonifractor capillosus]MBM6896586.1 ABC transporter permease [Pseudoflavonifractor capillosus]
MKQFFSNLKKYKTYAMYSAVASLRTDVSGSYFTWLWWILDPFLFMLVYTFISVIVFGKSEPHFVPMVFVGLGMWNFINRSINKSVLLVRGKKGILSRVYLPKYILTSSILFKHGIQMLITLGLALIVSVVDKVQFSWYILYTPLILLIALVLVFGASCIVMHCGVYARDFSNIITVLLKLVFYLSGVFYSIPTRIPQPYGNILASVNPAAMLINELRNVMIYAKAPNFALLGVWLLIGILVSAFGVSLIHKYEQNYVKAI